ncbi:M23 family metallopeptidase [Couchioplanes caeruleus]|uniref:Peptidase M23 n=2 Tax=Couchioplanes caeruleus TaxID=56438 RepID=A0A1K0FEZ0_9ACTN|nr:M23 family metallopeptidase [Couchioplanes caeruleus]OJF11401.1 peptidase M23 [Couchioplanes caeruleus subsp. caeruleus]ROP30147.1 peptidase M23-like protein [Couchioplanes caeruleus]
MRQRLSSEPDRYRGRRRVPTPPRSRYAAVVTSAFVGAGVVALGSASQLPDAKAVNPTVLQNLEEAATAQEALAERSADSGDRASRGEERTVAATAPVSEEEAAAQAWHLPLEDYEFTAPYGIRFGKLHAGIDLAAPEGTPYKAVHGGEVTSAGYNGGYGYSITVKHDDGTEMIYAHSRRLLVQAGDQVQAGQIIGEVGNTGYSYGTHLHLEVHVDGSPTDPIGFLRDHGVDIKLKIDSVLGTLAAS